MQFRSLVAGLPAGVRQLGTIGTDQIAWFISVTVKMLSNLTGILNQGLYSEITYKMGVKIVFLIVICIRCIFVDPCMLY